MTLWIIKNNEIEEKREETALEILEEEIKKERELPSHLRAPAALAENLGSVPRMLLVVHNHL